MTFQDSEVKMQDRVGGVEMAVDDAVDHGLPPECARMLRDIVFARILTYSVERSWATRLRTGRL